MASPPIGGETDLPTLLRTMRPTLHPSNLIITTLSSSTIPQDLPRDLEIYHLFREAEAWTLITTLSSALQHNANISLTRTSSTNGSTEHTPDLEPQGLQQRRSFKLEWTEADVYKMVTLNVHSSLLAVGFMKEVARVLADRRVPCNAVAGFYHDHLFVPMGMVEDALAALQELSQGGGG